MKETRGRKKQTPQELKESAEKRFWDCVEMIPGH